MNGFELPDPYDDAACEAAFGHEDDDQRLSSFGHCRYCGESGVWKNVGGGCDDRWLLFDMDEEVVHACNQRPVATKTCNRCGTPGLIWKNIGDSTKPAWRLFTASGSWHVCPPKHRPPQDNANVAYDDPGDDLPF